MPEFAEWDSFYVIVASAAGALIGLQFVVMTLVAQRPPLRPEAAAAYATPTIVHFSTSLLLAALLRAPRHETGAPAALCGLMGISGVTYSVIVSRRMRSSLYEPVLEDWLFHAVLPFAAYALLAASACEMLSHARTALFGTGGATLLLLFTGIHNAWDAVAYHVSKTPQDDAPKRP